MRILVIDVGGSHVKLHAEGWLDSRRFDSGPNMTPQHLVSEVRPILKAEKFDGISLGYPGQVRRIAPKDDPANLGTGWVGFDFTDAFELPVRVINDAAMQALGAHTGGRMLFLGLGTGLGSALVSDRVVVPLELGTLRTTPRSATLGEKLGKAGRSKLGLPRWRKMVLDAACILRHAMAADYVLLGGGYSAEVGVLPDGVRRGGNEDAFAGGLRLWQRDVELHGADSTAWRIMN